MKISTILDQIDSGFIALPEFQRGFVWNREQVRGLFHSLYRKHPVGGLLVWATEAPTQHRGGGSLTPGIVKLLLDGQQRMTTLYGVVRGHPPKFFDGNPWVITGLRFHLEEEIFEFYQPTKMKDDPLWVDVSKLMQNGPDGVGEVTRKLPDLNRYIGRLLALIGITAVDLHIEEVTGEDKTLDVVVDIFNRVNSGGTKLSQGDLALARVCADWPDGRNAMKDQLRKWREHGYEFTLDWLLRSVNTVLTGKAQFGYLHNKGAQEVQDGLQRATKQIDNCLNMIAGRLGLDHNRVLFGRFALPVMVRYLDRKGRLSAREQDRLLFWFAHAGMWGRFSGAAESALNQSLAALEDAEDGIDALLQELRRWSGNRRIEPGDFTGWSLGARFYPVLYMLTRMGEARDWGNGLPLKKGLLGNMNRLELHHIFPKAKLYAHDPPYDRPEVNALANYCFQRKETNLWISDRSPEEYFPEVENRNPGALASQWIPEDPHLWKLENYLDFLEARRILLAKEATRRFTELLHGDSEAASDTATVIETWHSEGKELPAAVGILADVSPAAGLAADSEEAQIAAINEWVQEACHLPRGLVGFELADEATGAQHAMLDLAWPEGLQAGLSVPVAILLNEPPEVLSIASAAGYRCFTRVEAFRTYVETEVLGMAAEVTADPPGQPGARASVHT